MSKMKLLGKRSLTLLLALVMSVSLVIPETMAEEDTDDFDDIEIESVTEEEEPEDNAVEYKNDIVPLTSDDYMEYENAVVPLTSDNAVDEGSTEDERNDFNISILPYKSGNSDYDYTSFAPKNVVNVSAYNDIAKAATAGMDTSVLSYLGLNVVSTDFYGLYPEGNSDIDLYLLTFGSEANKNPDPYLWNFYYNKYTYGLNSDVYTMDDFGDWKGDYTILNDATDGKDSGESDGSKRYTININGTYKVCDPLFFYEPIVLLGSSNASYDGGLAYYQLYYNPFYNPLEIGGWTPNEYCLNDGTFNSTVAMANAVYKTGRDITSYKEDQMLSVESRYASDFGRVGANYANFALGVYYYITGRLESNLDSWHLDMAKYCTGVSISTTGLITITNDGMLDNRYKQYLSDIGELAETGETYSSYGDIYNDGIRLIIGDLSDLTDRQRYMFNSIGIKLIDTNTEEGLPGTINGGLNTDSADTILGVPYFAGLLYKDQTGVSEWDMVAYYVENLCYVNPDYVDNVMDAMFTEDDSWSNPSEDYNDKVYEMIDYGGAYYQKYLDGSGFWLAIDDGWFLTDTEWPTGTAFAVYSADDNSLTFYSDSSVPRRNTTYNGKTVTYVYTGFDSTTYSSSSSVPWSSVRTDILAVEFDSSFKAVTPVSTSHWFNDCTNWVKSSGWQYFNTSKVTDMSYMFQNCSQLTELDVSNFNTKNVIDFDLMFNGCECLKTVDTSTWNTSNATSMTGMFYNCYELRYLNVASWDTSKVTSVARMFCDCYELNFILSDDNNFTMQAVEDNGSMMFYRCYKLNGGNGYPYQYISSSSGDTLNNGTDYTLAHVDTPDNHGYLTDISMLQSEDKIPFAVYSIEDDLYQLDFFYDSLSEYIDEVFVKGSEWHNYNSDQICFIPEDASTQSERSWSQYSIDITEVSFDGFEDYQPTSMAYWFYWFLNCDDFEFYGLDTSEVTSMTYLFYDCESLSEFDSTSSDYFGNTSNVTDMSCMFENCSSLEKLDVTNFDTSNVTDMSFMFHNCTNLNAIDVNRFNVQNVETLYCMFMFCRSLTSIDVSKWDVSSCYNYMRMFYGCFNLTELDLSGWDTRYFDTYWESKDSDEEMYSALSNFAVNCGPLDTIIIGDNFTLFADDKNHLNYINPMVDVQYWYKECALVSDDYMCGVSGAGTYTTYQGTHSYGDAVFKWDTTNYTATATRTCSVCGDVISVQADIAYQTTSATCTTDGKTVYTASATFTYDNKTFTDTYEVTIPATGHTWDTLTWTWDGYTKATASRTCSTCGTTETYTATITNATTKEPTCTVTGTKTYTATVTIDGTTYTNTKDETLSALGHDYGSATFTWTASSSSGYTVSAKRTCSRCSDTVSVTATVTSVTNPATCTTDGSITYTASAYFSYDGKTYTATKTDTIPATGHTWGALTWTWNGYTSATASRTCSTCGTTETYTATITCVTTNPTCTTAGSNVYTATVTVDGVKQTDTKTETLSALGHDYGDAVFTWNTSNYTATAQRTCSRCGNSVTMQADIAYQTTSATCTTDGKTVYTASATFTYDNKTFTDTYEVTIPATGHTWGTLTWTWVGYTSAIASRTCSKCNTTETYSATITSTTTNPTCTADGRTTYTATVTVDGQPVSDTKVETLPATGHSYGEPVWTWSAKSSGGYNVSAARTCANCGDVVSVTADVTSQTNPATCTEGGTIVYTASAYFSYDSKTYTDTRTDTIAATGHDWSALTWTWNGYTSATASRTCSKCNITETYTATITVVSTEPTCTTAGSNVYTATVTVDGVKQTNTKTETLSALGHDYGDPVWTWSTNHTTATAKRTCARCNNSVSVNATAETITTNATCTTDGKIVYSVSAYFSYDEKTFSTSYTETIPATGHNWGAVTFTWNGYTSATASRTCLNGCGTTETTSAKITSTTTDPTCTADGKTVYTATATFDGVNYTSTQEEKLDALGHNWSDVTFKWADDYSSATASRTCSRCNTTETATATITYTTPTAQTCTQDGLRIYTATVTLGNDKFTDTVEQVLPAYGHSYGDITFTWSSDYESATAQRVCTTCGYIDKKDATVKKVVTDPTCLDDGNTVYTATVTFDDGQTGSSERVTYQDALGHNWVETDTTTDSTHIAVTFKCSRCGTEKHETVMTEVTSKTGMTGGFNVGDINWHEFISEEEMLELDENAVIDFVVDIEDINATVSSSDKSAVQNTINNDSRASVFYLEVDLSMYVTNNGSTTEYELHDTPDEITIHITLPESMRFTEQGKYETIRVHNGTATMLETTVDDEWQLTFKSDKFSTYAITFLADYIELTVVKQGRDSSVGLQGAEFALQNSDGYWYTASEPDANGNIIANWQSTRTSRITDIDGKVTFPGLPDGTYTLYETGAPDGYYPLTETIQFTVTGGLITLITQSDSYWLSADRQTLYINDYYGNVFPDSGSTGTGIYIGTGLALLGVTFVLIIFRRKKVMAK